MQKYIVQKGSKQEHVWAKYETNNTKGSGDQPSKDP